MRQMVLIVPGALLALLCYSCNGPMNKEAKADVVIAAPVTSGAGSADTATMMEDKETLLTEKEDEQAPGNSGTSRQRNKLPAAAAIRKLLRTIRSKPAA